MKKHPDCVFDGKYLYYRKDFVIKTCKEATKFMAQDFEAKYIARNITEPSAEGEDVDVRFEQNIAKMNVKNIKMTGNFLADYFEECSKTPSNKKESE